MAPALVGAQTGNPPAVRSIELTGTVDPANERWLSEAMDDAEEAGAPLVILRLDTPGGLDTAMRSMVKRIITAPMPVVVYVSPDWARAASAGLFLTQAADIAAMASQTNIGSASPVQIGPGDDDEVSGARSATTPPPTFAPSRRGTAGTATWLRGWRTRSTSRHPRPSEPG